MLYVICRQIKNLGDTIHVEVTSLDSEHIVRHTSVVALLFCSELHDYKRGWGVCSAPVWSVFLFIKENMKVMLKLMKTYNR